MWTIHRNIMWPFIVQKCPYKWKFWLWSVCQLVNHTTFPHALHFINVNAPTVRKKKKKQRNSPALFQRIVFSSLHTLSLKQNSKQIYFCVVKHCFSIAKKIKSLNFLFQNSSWSVGKIVDESTNSQKLR